MNIYFHIDELNRDAIVASALARKLEHSDHKLVYGNRLSNRLLTFFHSAFDVIVVPRPHFYYDNWGDSWIKWDARLVTLSTESLGIICKDYKVMARTLLEKEYFQGKQDYVNRIDAFCIWGGRQKEAIDKYAGNIKDKFHIVGHPRHDSLCTKVATIPPENRKKVGIIVRTVGINDYFGRSALTAFETLFDDWHQYEFVNEVTGERLKSKRPGANPLNMIISQAIDAKVILESVKYLESLGYELKIRPHPKEDIETWRYILEKNKLVSEVSDPSEPITEWLEDIRCVVGPPSTSFYDSIMSGVPVVSLENVEARRKDCVDELWEDHNRLMPFVEKPSSIEALAESIENSHRLFDNEDLQRVLFEEANYPECRNSLDKVVAVLLEAGPSRSSNSVLLFFFRFSRFCFNLLWRLKSALIGRSENSAMFVLDRKVERYIDSLSRAN